MPFVTIYAVKIACLRQRDRNCLEQPAFVKNAHYLLNLWQLAVQVPLQEPSHWLLQVLPQLPLPISSYPAVA